MPCRAHQLPSLPTAPVEQVYQLLDDLLATGMSTLPPAFMHSSATNERLLALPTSAADAARRLKRFVRGGKASTFAAKKEEEGGDKSGDPTPPPVPETPSSRGDRQPFSPANADPLGAVAFDIPPDALPPPPARAAVARRAPVLAAPQRPTPPPPAFKGAVDEEAGKAPPPEAEGFGAFGEVEMLGACAYLILYGTMLPAAAAAMHCWLCGWARWHCALLPLALPAAADLQQLGVYVAQPPPAVQLNDL